MKPLRAKMLRYMERRGYSESTIRTYTMWVSQFALHYGKSPDVLSEDDIGAYLDHLKRRRKLSQSSLAGCYSGIKLLWEKVLGRSWDKLKLPRGKRAKTLPEVLSEEEVRELVCRTKNAKHRALLKVLYTTGVRVGELVKLKPSSPQTSILSGWQCGWRWAKGTRADTRFCPNPC